MRLVPRHLFWPLVFMTLACEARTPRAIAQPRREVAKETEAPLFAAELKEEADVARAIREHYVKYEYKIPMRDGAHLYTVAYVPKDRTRTYPILLVRTPYSVEPYGADNYPDGKNPRQMRRFAPSPLFVRDGYVIVHQDVRGRMMSEGTFVDVRPHAAKGGVDESTDAWDTIDWLVKNVPANSGKVGVWGISYPGFYAAQAAIDAHPALKAVSPQAPVTEWFLGDDFHHNGALFLAQSFDFYEAFGKARPKPVKKAIPDRFDYDAGDAYDFFLGMGALPNANERYLHGEIAFWNDMMAHGTRDDFWKARDPRPFYKNVKPAILTVGGLFDAEDCWGAFETYRAFDKQSARAEVSLVMGPWRHGGWARTDGDKLGDATFGAKTSNFYREKIEFPFFQRHLKGRPAAQPEAWMFETGTNMWQSYAAWPPPGSKQETLFFHLGGKLGAAAPEREDDSSADVYVSDPQKPVPYTEKPTPLIEAEYMTGDQRFASRRPDVLVYQTAPLDADVTLAGPLAANLWVTVTGTDADFVVKLVDVYPPDFADPEPNPTGVRMAGYQQLVRGEVMRGKFRDGFDKPTPFTPGEAAQVRFPLPDVSHTFRTGHRIMVQVQSSWFPLVDRNPQTFVDIYRAKDSDFHAATHRILRAPDRASGLSVTLARGALPR